MEQWLHVPGQLADAEQGRDSHTVLQTGDAKPGAEAPLHVAAAAQRRARANGDGEDRPLCIDD
ncbi:MAG TPA: hypothetical protein VFJ24_04125 [Gaiellales bacterium]|nr:hypothetical protein [Gaiellales bacterium]